MVEGVRREQLHQRIDVVRVGDLDPASDDGLVLLDAHRRRLAPGTNVADASGEPVHRA
jgi:hypothetical protein